MNYQHVKFFVILPVLCLLLQACGGKKTESTTTTTTTAKGGAGGKPRNVVAEGYMVHHQAFANNYTAGGSLVPNEEVEIHPEIAGRVTSITFREGAVVRKGQQLVQLYDADLRAQIQKLQAQRRLQQNTANRQSELLRIGGISRQEYEATTTQVRSIDADIAIAQADLRKTRIVAPFDGVVGLRNISVGAVVSPTTVVATLQQVNPLKMDFSVPDQYRNDLRMGQEVRFSVSGSMDTLTGKISAIDPGADVQTRTVRVRAVVPNSNRKLTAGSFAHVSVPLATNQSAILIPSQSLIPTTREKKVAVVRNGKADLVTVQTGVRTADMVEITAGLQAGDTILTTALMQVKPGMEVKVRSLRQ